MTDFRAKWVVMVGQLYVSGIGEAYEGYRKGPKPLIGIVGSPYRENAYEFISLEDATRFSARIGGQVFRA